MQELQIGGTSPTEPIPRKMRIDAVAAAGKLLVEPSLSKDRRSVFSIPTNFAAGVPA
jgi:hypothetical protein